MSNYFDHLLLLLGYRRCSVVSLSVTVVSAAKPVEPIEMLSGLRARMCPRNHKLDGPDPPRQGAIFGGKGHPL